MYYAIIFIKFSYEIIWYILISSRWFSFNRNQYSYLQQISVIWEAKPLRNCQKIKYVYKRLFASYIILRTRVIIFVIVNIFFFFYEYKKQRQPWYHTSRNNTHEKRIS